MSDRFIPKPGVKLPRHGAFSSDVPEAGVRINPGNRDYYRRAAARGEGTIAAASAKAPAPKPKLMKPDAGGKEE